MGYEVSEQSCSLQRTDTDHYNFILAQLNERIKFLDVYQQKSATQLIEKARRMFDKERNRQEHDNDSLDGLSHIANRFDYFGHKVDKTYQDLGGH